MIWGELGCLALGQISVNISVIYPAGTGWRPIYRIPEAIYDDEDAIFLIMLALLLGRNAEIKL